MCIIEKIVHPHSITEVPTQSCTQTYINVHKPHKKHAHTQAALAQKAK